MNVRIHGDIAGHSFDQTYSGANEYEIFLQFRETVRERIGHGVGLIGNAAFIRRAVDAWNESTRSQEPIPVDIAGFFAFGRKVGLVTDIS